MLFSKYFETRKLEQTLSDYEDHYRYCSNALHNVVVAINDNAAEKEDLKDFYEEDIKEIDEEIKRLCQKRNRAPGDVENKTLTSEINQLEDELGEKYQEYSIQFGKLCSKADSLKDQEKAIRAEQRKYFLLCESTKKEIFMKKNKKRNAG